MTTKNTKNSADQATKATKAVFEANQEVFENAMKSGSEAVNKMFEQAAAFTGQNSFDTKGAYDEAADFGRKNVEAFTAMASVMTAGFEAYNQKMVESFKNASAFNMACVEKAAAAKTPQDFAAVQMETAAEAMEQTVSNAMEMNKFAMDVVTKSVEPVKARMETVMEEMASKAAA